MDLEVLMRSCAIRHLMEHKPACLAKANLKQAAMDWRLCYIKIFALMLTCLTGCGGNENLAYVTGKITLDGKPLPNAFVVFAPTAGGTTSYGRSDAEGNYEMVFSDAEKGAWIGENRVEISTGDVDASGDGGGAKEKVPAVYNRNTSLKVDVVAGNNTHNFDLKSDAGRIVQPVE